ncbi:MAG: hypothetical protein HY731_02225 [Candidatus Tectomicrobia bacterium]|nr:hypothetical protein [Candidatus Tectomicrobia bacterium]
MTAESSSRALKMYSEGADYVFLPRILAAQHLIPILELILSGDEEKIEEMKNEQIEELKYREEIVS